MAKAQIKRPDGTIVTVDGTPAEIAEVIERVGPKAQSAKVRTTQTNATSLGQRASLPDLIASLIDGGFFRQPKDLAAIKSKLAELGHVYPVTTLSPAMLRIVRKKHVRRLKQDSRWVYTG